jgi:signal transduction histidine kinase/ligand-binding sensor domain-containing protein
MSAVFRFRGVLVVLFVAIICPGARALNPSLQTSQYGHAVWRIQDGYLPGIPETVAQTTDGYLWIGTYAGLVRFDGVRFVPWSPPDGKPFPDSRIFSLLGGKDGSLWIGTGKGLARWKAGELSTYSELSGRVNAIVEDADGNIWVVRSLLNDNRGPLCRVTGNDPRCYGQADGMPLPTATRLTIDKSGNFWIGGFTGLCRWKPGSPSSTFFQKELKEHGLLLGIEAIAVPPNGDIWISLERPGGRLELWHFADEVWKNVPLAGVPGRDPGISALFVDHDGSLWIGTGRRGIFRIYGDKTDHFSSADGLSSDAIAIFFQDREGTLWVASSKGLDSFRDLPVTSFSMREGLTADSVSTVLATRDGTVWIGNSGALDFLKQGKLSAIRTSYGLPGRDVTTMFEDHTGRLWVGLDSGLFVFVDGKFQEIRKPDGASMGITFGVTEDTDHRIWVRSGTALFYIEDRKVPRQVDVPQIAKAYSLAPDPRHGVWLGFDNGDIAHYHDNQLELFAADPNVSTGQMRKLLPEPDGSVWIVTQKGLVWWKEKRRRILTTRNGLPCDELYTAIGDDEGTLWLYTRCGLASITASQMKLWQSNPTAQIDVETFDIFDGVQPGVTPLQPQASISRDGRFWFANDTLLQVFDAKLFRKNATPPSVIVERVIADGVKYRRRSDNFTLPALTRNLEIDYTAPSFVVPQKVLFRYKLEGHDAGWQESQTRRQAFYSDLKPGKYRFLVSACNNDGVWNEAGTSMDFSVAPAFYQTFWFGAFCAGVLIAILWLIYLLRMRQVSAEIRARMEERLGERERIARELHDTLLQGVQGLILQFHAAAKQIPSQEPARQTLENALDRADEVLVEGRERVRNLRTPAELSGDLAEALRLAGQEAAHGSAASFAVVVEGTARELQPLIREEVYAIGREAVVNAFRHSNSVRIEVEISYESAQLRLRVRDDGRGIDPAVLNAGGRQDHWGLQGMRERASHIGARIEIWSRAGSGTEVDLRIAAARAYKHRPVGFRWFWLRRVFGRNG